MQPQQGHRSRPGCPNLAILVAKYHSSGWRRDLEHVLKVYYKHSMQTPFQESEWARVRELFFDRITPKKAEVMAIKEELQTALSCKLLFAGFLTSSEACTGFGEWL